VAGSCEKGNQFSGSIKRYNVLRTGKVLLPEQFVRSNKCLEVLVLILH
jgi:hypothetical protein